MRADTSVFGTLPSRGFQYCEALRAASSYGWYAMGIIQVWTGLMIETAEDWSILVRPPANLPRNLAFDGYEGIIEADRWFGPLFTNIRLIKTDVPIHFNTEIPLLQIQPLHRRVYSEEVCSSFDVIGDPAEFSASAWSKYEETIVKPNLDPERPIAAYATAVRRRRKSECPMKALVGIP
jgi:hypothetical protein